MTEEEFYFNDRLKVLSYWNLNNNNNYPIKLNNGLKVLSYWNLNITSSAIVFTSVIILKYYHIGI